MIKVLKGIVNFVIYVRDYNLNTLRMAKLQYENENYKEILEYKEKKFKEQNDILKLVDEILINYKKRICFVAPEVEEVKELIEKNIEKKFADEIIGHFTSTN